MIVGYSKVESCFEKSRMLLKKLSILILTFNSLVVLAESENFLEMHRADSENLVFGEYIGSIHKGGSGSLRKRFDPEVIKDCKTWICNAKRENPDLGTSNNFWGFHIRNDEMTDEQLITVTRSAYFITEDFDEIPIKSGISLYLDLSDKDYEVLCVLGHDFPGMIGMIRVDKTPAIETKENGCLQLTKELDSQLRSGSKITIRGFNFPYSAPETRVIELGGYSEMSDFLRSRRRQ